MSPLQQAVLDQLGIEDPESEDSKGTLEDISSHGADAGWAGFTYYSDTVDFFKYNRSKIVKAVEEMADGIGEQAVDMVRNFRCLGAADYSQADVARVMYGSLRPNNDTDDLVANALAWFALEEVARQLVDC